MKRVYNDWPKRQIDIEVQLNDYRKSHIGNKEEGIAKLTSKSEQNHLHNLKQQRFAKQ